MMETQITRTTHANFSGTWRLDLARSVLKLPPVSEMLMRIIHDDPSFDQSVRSVGPDGAVMLGRYVGRTDGEDFHIKMQGLYPARSQARWQGDELVIESRVDVGGREIYLRDHWSLANPDELHMVHRDDALDGQIAILTRVADAEWPP